MVLGRVKHSQSLSEPPLLPWFAAEADGAVCCGHCTCMAGLCEAFLQVAALLFAVDCRNRMESEVTCTSVLCEWKKPPSKRVDCLSTSEIDFVSPKRKLSEPSKPSVNKAKHIAILQILLSSMPNEGHWGALL